MCYDYNFHKKLGSNANRPSRAGRPRPFIYLHKMLILFT
jgi:hypothetical protein